MPNEINEKPKSIDNLDKKLRHSMQPKESPKLPQDSLRPSQSHRGIVKKKKRTIILAPINDNQEDTIEGEEMKSVGIDFKNEREKERRASKRSEISAKAALAYDNAAYEDNLDRFSRAGSSKASSVQSLEIVREQYCCCAKRTPCERKLLVIILVLLLMVIVLVVVIIVISGMGDKTDMKSVLRLNNT